ncbi:MAG: UDP-glucose/GDP-mannose dehydrogenase family protein [Burkholderiales bacterium]
MRVSIVGTGYVGLVSGVCLADKGHDVVCVDVVREKVERINAGEPPIYEAGLAPMLQRLVASKKLVASLDLEQSVIHSDLTMIAVGTPFDGYAIDLTYIREVARQIGRALANKDGYHVVIVKSTVVPGTTEEVVLPLLEQHSGKKAGRDFGVGMNPEFLREGEAIADFMQPSRIVLGGIDDRSRDVLGQLYECFPAVDKLHTSPRTAEMIKYAANSLLATLISFANEIGNLCMKVGDVDVVEVLRGVCLDTRFSPILADGTRIKPQMTNYVAANSGFGGSCFPKDVKALIEYGERKNSSMRLLRAVIDTNQDQPNRLIELIEKHHPDVAGLRIAVLGLAFKAGTDDVRESPALPLVRQLRAKGAKLRAFDPVAQQTGQAELGSVGIEYSHSLSECVADAEVVVAVTAWPEFRDLPKILATMGADPLVVDGRRMFRIGEFARYEGIGFQTLPADGA